MAIRDHWDAMIAGGAAVFVAIWNNRKIEAVRHGVNGALDKLLRANTIASYGKGQQREREDQAKRDESPKKGVE
jgi:hypothetical protein